MKWASSKLWAFGTGKLCFTDSIQRVLGVQGPLLVSGGIFIWHSALSRIKVLGTGHLGSHLTSGASTGSHYSSCIHSPLIPSTEAHVQAGILVSTRGAFKVYKAPGTAKALNTPSTGSTLAQSSGMLYKDG